MSRVASSVTIRPARNGFWVEETPMAHNAGKIIEDPWVFESFDSMVKWLEDNYIEGNQPGSTD